MLHRAAEKLVRDRLDRYPAVALIGPRQSGKTTLAKAIGGVYYDLEVESDRLRLDLEWGRRTRGTDLVLLDEAQTWPGVFPRLRSAIDADRGRKGRFLLLGSVAPSLMTQVSESLAGRLSLVELTPFLWSEVRSEVSLRQLWLTGGFPDGGVLDSAAFPQWQRDFMDLLTHRDLPSWGLPAKPRVTDRLVRMLAAVHGQTWNASQIGESLGVSYHTVNDYVDYLVGAFLVRRLSPYQANVRKRLVKRPKLLWRDTGLLHAMSNTTSYEAMLSQPWVGASWEGFVIEQVIGTLKASGAYFDPYYFRTSDQKEVDLVIDWGESLWAIEVKLTSSPRRSQIRALASAADLIGADRRFLVSQTEGTIESDNTVSCNLPWLLETCSNRLVGLVRR